LGDAAVGFIIGVIGVRIFVVALEWWLGATNAWAANALFATVVAAAINKEVGIFMVRSLDIV